MEQLGLTVHSSRPSAAAQLIRWTAFKLEHHTIAIISSFQFARLEFLLCIAIVSGSLVSCISLSLTKPTATITATASSTATPSSTPTSTFIPTSTSTSPASSNLMAKWVLYRDKKITFVYSTEWRENKSTYIPICQQAECLVVLKSANGDARLTFFRAKVSGFTTLEEFEQRIWDGEMELLASLKLESMVKLDSKETIQVDGEEAIKRVFSKPDILSDGTTQNVYVIRVQFEFQSYLYNFSFSGDSAQIKERYDPEISRILETIRFLP